CARDLDKSGWYNWYFDLW
nr:immunoglobulin heavy chain junction region [Macaca mulatta]MPN71889.1 immunoglobulin heavy chain junction region [Macaca mulatta]MPN73925.1 immunoglobulin heavy chain junction region [Macaca mulatta]MPN73992.1 immunoglobulin heavy chain junction region [Macaca mulatta]MPN75479.1 immunoglobulin heavy chain junction region [Macaca mulatta]